MGMDDGKTRVEVRIYGESYVIRADDADEEYVRRLAEAVDARMRELAGRNPSLSVTRIAVLAALNLADELWRLREQHRVLLSALQRRLAEVEAALDRRPAPAPAGRLPSAPPARGELP